MVFEHVAEDIEIYPSVGLRHTHEAIRVNFGHEPFKYDIDDHVQQQRDAIWARIQQTSVDWRALEPGRTVAAAAIPAAPLEEREKGAGRAAAEDDQGREEAGRLVLSYLVHHGYAKTAHAFETQLARTAAVRRQAEEPLRPASPALPVPPRPGPEPATADPDADADSPMPDADDDDDDADDADDGATLLAGVASAAPAARGSSTREALEQRLAIVHAVQRGDMDTALWGAEARFPEVLAREQGLVLLKLRCRKFVELVNEAAEMKRRVGVVAAASATAVGADGAGGGDGMDAEDGVEEGANEEMEVDDGYATAAAATATAPATKSAAEAALRDAITYGQALQKDYRRDARREVQTYLDRTFSVVAYHFPLEAGGAVGAWAGQEARDALAAEINQAILGACVLPPSPRGSFFFDFTTPFRRRALFADSCVVCSGFACPPAHAESQGWPARPALERVYRQTAASLVQLGYMGIGAAVFADLQRELLDG